MQPIPIAQSSESSSCRSGNRIVRPPAGSGASFSQGGACDGVSFWKKRLPAIPSG